MTDLISEEVHGEILMNRYVFEEIGDKLEMHRHIEKQNHIILCCRGKLKISTTTLDNVTSFNTIILKPGDYLDLDPEIYHEIEALETNSMLANVFKYLIPSTNVNV
jgi:quercetin dioxygenase-like cupin family protein